MNDTTPKTVTASEAKLHFGDILNQCVYGQTPIVIKKHNRPVAVILHFDEWKKRGQDAPEKPPDLMSRIDQLRDKIARYQKEHHIKPGPSSVELIRELRKESERRAIAFAKPHHKKGSQS